LTDDDASRICASCECDRERRPPRLLPRQRGRPFCPRSIRLLLRQWPLQCRCVWPLFSSPLRDCVYVARSHPEPSQGLARTGKQREILKSVSTISFYSYVLSPSSKSNRERNSPIRRRPLDSLSDTTAASYAHYVPRRPDASRPAGAFQP